MINEQRNKIKIIHIIDAMSVGGAQTFLINLLKGLDPEIFEFKVITIIEKGFLAQDLEKLGIEVVHLQKKGKIGFSLIYKLTKFLKQEKPDIVHTHIFGADTQGRIAAFLARVPIIISTEHNVNPDQGLIKRLVKKILSLITFKIIATSAAIRDYSIKNDKIAADKFALIHYGIDLDAFLFRGFKEIDLQNIRAGVIARLELQKGHTFLIQALPEIIKKYPGFNLQIIGEGHLEGQLKNEVAKLNLQKNAQFVGVRHDMAQVLNNLDIVILPSLWEGQGISILEAQAVGVPVLAANVDGIKEIVLDKQTGLLFFAQNPRAIFSCVDSLLSNPELIKQMLPKARQLVEEKYSLKQMIANYQKFYLAII